MSKKTPPPQDLIHMVTDGNFSVAFCPDARKLEAEAYSLNLQARMAGLAHKTKAKSPPKEKPELRISALIPKYINWRLKGWTDGKKTTLKRHVRELCIFLSVTGDKDVNFITKQDFSDYRNLIINWPNKFNSKERLHKCMAVEEIASYQHCHLQADQHTLQTLHEIQACTTRLAALEASNMFSKALYC